MLKQPDTTGTVPIFRKRGTVPIFLALALAGCVTPPEHDAFKRVMDHQVGKNVDDVDFYPVLYKLRLASTKGLPNGNLEYQYAAGRRGRCELYFEAAPITRQVVRWRYEGGERECVIETRANP